MASLTPAYGRDYKSAKAALEDFHADKDFIHNSPSGCIPTNKSDMIRLGDLGMHQIRYNKIQKVTVVTL